MPATPENGEELSNAKRSSLLGADVGVVDLRTVVQLAGERRHGTGLRVAWRNILLFLLLGVLGWKVFGPPLQG